MVSPGPERVPSPIYPVRTFPPLRVSERLFALRLLSGMDKEKSGSVCRLVHGFGLRTGVQDNVLCVDETTAIFPVGRALAQLNIETRVMSFVSEGERADLVLALALAPSRRFARVPFQLVVKTVPLPVSAADGLS